MPYDSQAWHDFCDAMTTVRREQDNLRKALSLGPATCANCHNEPPRWDSLFCSDACKQVFLNFEEER